MPGDDDVLVEVRVCCTCTQWDITTWRGIDIFEREGHPQYPLAPGATGHEMAGVVVEVGRNVTRLQPGDHVAYWGNPPGATEPPGGCYAQYAVRNERAFVRYPRAVPFEQAALTEIFTCLTGSLFKAGEVVGKRVGVSGMGPAGLIAIQALKARGAAEVVAFDIEPSRLEHARKLGADQAILPGSPEWTDLTPRARNLDIAIDCIGVAPSVNNLMKVTRDHVIIFGVAHGPIHFDMGAWMKGLKLEATGPRPEKGADYARHMLTTGQVRVDSFIGARLPLTAYAEGVQLLVEKKAIKVAFLP